MNNKFLNLTLLKLPEYLLYLFVFFLPWQTRWIVRNYQSGGVDFEYGRISLYGFDCLLIILVLYCLAVQSLKWLNKKDKNSRFKFVDFRAGLVFLLFYFFIFLSLSAAPEKLTVVYWAGRMGLGFGLWWLIQKIEFSKTKLALAAVMAGVLQGVLAVWQFGTQAIWQSKWLGMAGQSGRDLGASVVEFGLERWLRAYGSLPHPNILGGLAVLAFAALIYLLSGSDFLEKPADAAGTAKLKLKQLSMLVAAALVSAGIFFSFSRAAWIGWLISLAGGMWLVGKIKENWARIFGRAVVLSSLLLLLIFSAINWSVVQTRLGLNRQPARLELKSNMARLNGYKQAAQMIEHNWLLGVGIGNYTFALKEADPAMTVWEAQPVHNTFLLAAAELGISAFLIAAMLLGYTARSLIKRRQWAGAGLFGLGLFLMLFDHYFWTLATGVYVSWLIVGVVAKASLKPQVEDTPKLF